MRRRKMRRRRRRLSRRVSKDTFEVLNGKDNYHSRHSSSIECDDLSSS